MYRVLVVDDEKLERDGIRFLLSIEEGEWEIYEAANGKLALNELRKHPVDLRFPLRSGKSFAVLSSI